MTSAPGGTTGNKTTLSSSLPTFGPLLGRKGIRPRLLTFLTCALLLPGLATTSLVYFTVRNSLCEAALREDLVLSRRIAEKVSSFLNTAQQALNTLAIEQDGPQKRSAFPLRKFLLKFPFFSEVATYDLEGKGLNHAVRSNTKVVWGPYSYSRMGPKEISQAKEGQTHRGPIRFSNENNSPEIVLTYPLENQQGFIIARLNLQRIFDLLEESESPTNLPFLVNKKGDLIAHPDQVRIQNKENWSNQPMVKVTTVPTLIFENC